MHTLARRRRRRAGCRSRCLRESRAPAGGAVKGPNDSARSNDSGTRTAPSDASGALRGVIEDCDAPARTTLDHKRCATLSDAISKLHADNVAAARNVGQKNSVMKVGTAVTTPVGVRYRIGAAVPSDQRATGTRKMVSGSGTSRSSRTTGEPGRLAPQLAAAAFGT